MTPAKRYQTDPEYHLLVDSLEDQIHRARFTPTELQEACILACINYEHHRLRPYRIDDACVVEPKIAGALQTLEAFLDGLPTPGEIHTIPEPKDLGDPQ